MSLESKLKAISKELSGKLAEAGFRSESHYEDGTPVAYVAAIQEFGDPSHKIPPRPFFRSAISEHKEEWSQTLAGLARKAIRGEIDGNDAFDGVGILMATDIQAQIAKTDSPALSPITVLLRKWRKEGRVITGATVGEAARAIAAGVDPGGDNKPLNDSGLMISSVTHAVVEK